MTYKILLGVSNAKIRYGLYHLKLGKIKTGTNRALPGDKIPGGRIHYFS